MDSCKYCRKYHADWVVCEEYIKSIHDEAPPSGSDSGTEIVKD